MYNYKNKIANIKMLNNYMLARTLSMFDYENLPATLPAVEIEKQLQKNGFTFITQVEGELYAFHGGLGGEPNAYGEPTEITITNPALNFSKTLNIENDGVLIKNDDMQLGVFNLFEKYNTLLIENEITMFINSYNSRIQSLISTGDDATKESAELYIKKIIEGELGIIGENRLFDGISVQSSSGTNLNITTQLIEFNQYVKASLYNEIGLNMNFNMKRERLNSGETDMNTDNLRPLIDNMLQNRVQGIEKLNELYDESISVEFGSIWKVNEINDTMTIDEPITEHEETENVPRETIEPDEEVEPITEHEETENVPRETMEVEEVETLEDIEDIDEFVLTDDIFAEAYQMNEEFDEKKEVG